MTRPRMPDGKAELSGAKLHDPGRFADRKPSKLTRPVGEPYERMTETEREAWAELVFEIPWLNSSHRPLLRVAAMYTAMIYEGSAGVRELQALAGVLSKLGATPVDETRVNHDDGDGADPAGKFFN